MNWVLPAFFGLIVFLFVIGIVIQVHRFPRNKKAWQMLQTEKAWEMLHTGQFYRMRYSEFDYQMGLITMTTGMYFFLEMGNLFFGDLRTGNIALYANWWIDGLRLFLVLFTFSLFGFMGLHWVAKRKPESDFAKKFAADAPKLKSIRNSLVLFAFLLVIFTFIGMFALVFLDPEVRALNGM